MSKRIGIPGLMLAAGLALQPGPAAAEGQALQANIVIADQELRPSELRVQKGETIAWVSQAEAPCTIVFDSEIARSMVCHSLVNFRMANSELRSMELKAGDLASFCELSPGSYRYEVRRQESPGQELLEGTIVVEAH
jgi:plastocyanin